MERRTEMANESHVTIVGNITDDPELRFTSSGNAIATLTVATTPRIYDSQKNEWRDGDASFMRCNIWREQGENVAESLQRGNRVVVTGRLKQSNWETKEGEKRSRIEIDVDEIGASMKFASVTIHRAERASDNDNTEDEPEPPRKRQSNGRSGSASRSRTRARA